MNDKKTIISICYADIEHRYIFESWPKRRFYILLTVILLSLFSLFSYFQYQKYLSQKLINNAHAISSKLSTSLTRSSLELFTLEQSIVDSEQEYSQIITSKNAEKIALDRRVSTLESQINVENNKSRVLIQALRP